MKTKLLILLLWVAITFFIPGCIDNTNNTENIKLKTSCFPVSIKKGHDFQAEFIYNNNSKLTEIVNYASDEISGYLVFTYGKSDRLHKLEYKNEQNEIVMYLKYYYNQSGLVNQINYFVKTADLLQKRDMQSKFPVKSLSKNLRKIYKSDLINSIIQMKSPSENFVLAGYEVYDYSNGNIVKSTFYSELLGQPIMVFYTKFQHDENGNVIKTEEYNVEEFGLERGILVNTYEYEYDTKNHPLIALRNNFVNFAGESLNHNIIKQTETQYRNGRIIKTYITNYDYEYNKFNFPEKSVETVGSFVAIYDNEYAFIN